MGYFCDYVSSNEKFAKSGSLLNSPYKITSKLTFEKYVSSIRCGRLIVLSGVLKKASSGECVWVFLKAGGEMPIHMFLYLDVHIFCKYTYILGFEGDVEPRIYKYAYTRI